MLDLRSARRSPDLVPCSVVHPLPAATRYTLRGGPQVMSAAGRALGFEISTVVCRSAGSAGRWALWLGPDEQLLLTSPEDGSALSRQLGETLSGLPHSLVDVSHRQIAVEVSGAAGQTALSAGCPLDLDPTSFPVGMCTRTVLGKAQIVLWRTGAETFHLEVWRSFAEYVTRFLAEAARELAC